MLGALWGSVVGDALGVPVEFTDRDARRLDSVVSMRGGGVWRQPPGTWSDDSSLLLCSAESLLDGFDPDDMGRKFVDWLQGKRWTPWGEVFDIGSTTRRALGEVARGVAAELAGGITEGSNGNGSLMRIIPVALHSTSLPVAGMLERIHRASAITHRHPRSQMACGLFSLVAQHLLRGESPVCAWEASANEFRGQYGAAEWAAERARFDAILEADLADLPESEIKSDGYVLHTLAASMWCLLNTESYSEAVLRAVNLGGDADRTGCVTGGLAGLSYGYSSIPEEWIATLARRAELDQLFRQFASIHATSAPNPPGNSQQ